MWVAKEHQGQWRERRRTIRHAIRERDKRQKECCKGLASRDVRIQKGSNKAKATFCCESIHSLFPWKRTSLTDRHTLNLILSMQSGPLGGATRDLETHYACIGEFDAFFQYSTTTAIVFRQAEKGTSKSTSVLYAGSRSNQSFVGQVPWGVQPLSARQPVLDGLVLYDLRISAPLRMPTCHF